MTHLHIDNFHNRENAFEMSCFIERWCWKAHKMMDFFHFIRNQHFTKSTYFLLMKSEKIEIKDAVQDNNNNNKNYNNFSPSQHGTACCALMYSVTYITFSQSGSQFNLLLWICLWVLYANFHVTCLIWIINIYFFNIFFNICLCPQKWNHNLIVWCSQCSMNLFMGFLCEFSCHMSCMNKKDLFLSIVSLDRIQYCSRGSGSIYHLG